MRYLLQVVGLWFALLTIFLVIASIFQWNELFIGLTIGVIVGFLPSVSIAILDNSRSWNIENIEKIYAPLIGEITNLQNYFGTGKQLSQGLLFDYGESRDHLLSMAVWNKIHDDNVAYRLRLDDEKLEKNLFSFYLVLSFYIKNREIFLSKRLDPILNKLLRKKDPNAQVDETLNKIKGLVRNLVLDAFDTSSGKIALGFYTNFTDLNADFEQTRTYTGISEKKFDDFLMKVGEQIKDAEYGALLEQRRNLYRDVQQVRHKIEQKLEKARPT